MKVRTSRRALFGSTALLATLPSFARPHGPDRELIAACGAYIAAYRVFVAACNATEEDEASNAAWHAWEVASKVPFARMKALRAVTAEGLHARTLALREYLDGDTEVVAGDVEAELLSFLLRDAAALGGAA